MNDKAKISFNEYLSKFYEDFDESTLISPNKNGENENGIIDKLKHEFKKDNLFKFCKSNSISINGILLAGLTLTLNKFNFSDEALIFNQNNVPFAAKFENRNVSIKEFLKEIQENYNKTLEFDEYVNDDDLLLKPEFYYSFNENPKQNLEYSNYLNIVENDETVSLSLYYNDELYTGEFIGLFLSGLEKIINQIIDADIENTDIGDIALVSEKDDIAFSEVEMPLLHKRFEKQAIEKSDETALVASDATLTYRQLDEKANIIANSLIKRGVKPKSNVLIMLSRDSNLIASILGILKAGCAFIPIDPEYPAERIKYIYENSQADYIISNESRGNFLDINELIKGDNAQSPDINVQADDLAYMIYTSGSTGNPKGVMISHINACNETAANPKCEYNNLLSIATIAFDTSLEDILTGLTNGIEIIFANDVQIKNIIELIKLIKKYEPEVMEFTPSRLLSYLEVDEFCNAIGCAKCIVMGGEQFSAKAFDLVKKYCDAVVYNSYGPTEATIASNYKEITDANEITIGKALENYVTEVRDLDGKLLPCGIMGELYIGGVGVGKGYYNMPDKTEEVFTSINDIPYYRSGDYAIELPNGELVVKGRIDNQIKLRGLRIEIGEIESNIGQYPDINQVAVVIKEINNNDHLCAYYTSDGEIDSDDLKEYLKDRLTRYMVPTVFMQLDEMPQTPNGKTDLKQLPEPQLRLSLTLPQTDTEERLMDIVSCLTETKEFGTTDDLYAIGFTSLTLMKLNAMIYDDMGVNLDIIALLNDPTIKNIANEIENNDILDLGEVIELSSDMEYYPLTENQMGIYYECIQSGDVAQYNLPSIIRFDSKIDEDRLKRAIIKTIEAYPYLKTRIVTQKGKVMLKRDDSIAIDDIPIVEVNEICDDEVERENLKRFDLHNDQLFRFKIYKTASETVLFGDVHHIISDGESLDKLFANIANAYQGIEIEKEEVDGYINCLIESENENSEKYAASKEFFHDMLTREVDSTILTPNLNGNYEDGILKSVSKNINPELINRFCSENKITPNVLFMAVTMLNLNKYTFSDKTLITTIFNGRSNSAYINTQALMVKTLPIVSINEDRTLTFKEYLNSVNDIWMETISHCDYPYTKISEEFGLKPEFFYAYNNLDAEEIEIDGNVYKVNYLDSLEVNYKISLDVNETRDNIELFLQYNNQLYSTDYIEVFLDCIIDVISQLTGGGIEELSIGEIELGESKETPTFTPVDTPILHKRFENQVVENPDDIALVAGDATLTYSQLDEKANRIANALIKRGVKPKSNVLVMLPRTSNLIASILGILKAGCAFIPIDPEYPAERINYIYENSQADYIIADEASETSLDVNELLMEESTENPNADVTSDDLAYMIYTSGSTGNPKGVMISHENICNQASNPKSTYESLLCVTTISFDVSVDDILTSLSNGLKLIFADDIQVKNIPELIKLIDENKPEVLEITPSRFASYLEVGEFCNVISCLKCLFLGGEQFSAKVFEDLRKYSDAVVYNSYGPTETTITSNNKEVTDVNDLTVGLPLANYITDVRDIDGKLLPLGVMGELYIGGTGVGKGYYNMEDKTKEVFLTIDDIPYYRSGDYAIELPNGEIDIKGRIDNQIKLRGLRIEIGEIESNIGQYPNIKQDVVVIKEINNNDHLCAYYTADGEIDSDDLKEYLKQRLTRYMVPTVFMQLDEMPQTPNGKTDLKQLPEPQLRLSLTFPETETEERLMDIVSSLTETREFGTTDDLYAIGFTSLTLMKLNAMIYEEIGVNLDIIALLNDPTIKNIAKNIDNDSDEYNIDELIELAKDTKYYPLTENQLGIYYECMQSPGVIKYTMPTTVRFDSDVDVDKLKQAVIDTIGLHPYLKTRIVTHEGELRQKRIDEIAMDDIEIVKVDSISDEEIMENDVRPFDLDNNQLFRFKIYDTSKGAVLFSDFHHIIADGVSQINLFNEIADFYENRSVEEERVDGYIYSLIEKNIVDGERYSASKEFFNEKLGEDVESTVLTPNLNGNPDEGKLKEIVEFVDSKSIDDFCNQHSISKNTLFMAGTVLTLNKFTFTSNTLLTTIFNGRSSSNFYNTQAMLVKTLPFIVTNENRKASLKEFIKSVDDAWKDTINHSFYPYTKIAEDYQLKPEFFYSYHEFLESEDMVINNKSYEPKELLSEDFIATDYKIDFVVTDMGENVELRMGYNDQLYSEEYIHIFLDSMKFILNQFMTGDISESRICDLSLEPERPLPEFSKVELPFIHKRFEKQADENPDGIALVASDATLTYAELDQKANRIANALINKGVKAKSNVLVMLPRTSNLIASILGILKAGCAFIPIDPEYPQDRINYIYENSQADYIIADEASETSLDVNELLMEESTENPNADVTSDDLAYMIYTSGSTGNPKGVMISHENICNQASNPKSTYESLLCVTTISFDVSVDDIMTSLSNGLKLIFADDTQVKNIPELIKLIGENKPEVLEITPSRFASYLEVGEFCNVISCLKCVFLGGEQFSAKVFEDLRKYSDAVVYNSYGPTETTITSNNKEVTDVNDLTVGLPLANYITDVRDIDGKLVPNGVMGELYIGGTGVGKGYYNMPDKTEEVFLTINDIPYYRSGDYAIELPNGEIDIKGRIDNQIKLRGLRIEIGEIETNIGQYPDIKQAVVVIKEINGYDHLCAYYTADGEIDSDDLKEYLKDRLTRYMVPTVFMQLDEMPHTPNGKTDLKQLPEPQLKLALVMPETETEEKLHEIVSSLVSIEEFGVTDDLYAIGFTSLTLMKLNSIIYEQMGGNLDITVLFNEPTIKNLAIELDNTLEKETSLEEFIESAKGLDYYPLTENQLGIYYECVQSPDVIKYTMPTAVRFGSDVDAVKLKDAVIGAIEAHPYLKTRIVTHEGELKQKRCDDIAIDDIEIVKVDSVSDEDFIENDIRPISFDGGQLFRFKIYETPDEVVLFSDFHHIITDGVSQINLFEDIANIYEDRDIEEEIIDGFIYSMLEKDMENSEKYQLAKEFFDDKLTQEIDSTVLTPDLSGDPDSGKIKDVTYTINSKLINEFCNDNSISKNNLFMASTILCLNKFTFTDKTLITTIFNGRSTPNYYNTQAFLVKTIPLIIDNENRQVSIREFIKSVNESWRGSLNNCIYPYTKIAEKYQLKPEFFYAYHEFLESDDMIINDKVYEPYEIDDGDLVTADAKINLAIYDEGDEFNLLVEYNDQLYTEEYVEKFLKSIETILGQLIENDLDVCKIEDIGIESESQITEFGEIGELIIHERFEKQADETPDNVALIASDETLSYRQLDQKANRIANALIKKGVKPKSRILIMLPRDSNLISSIFGVLKAGCAYIPIDMAYPQDRVDYIYENSQADYIIAGETEGNALGINDLLKEENTERPGIQVSPDDLIYMIYTSGSTGNPKGVMIAHKNVANLFAQTYENPFYENFSKINKSLSITSISFDPFMIDLSVLTLGAKMVFADDETVKDIKELTLLINREKPDAITSGTPSRISQYMEYSGFRNELKNFKQIYLGGEMMSEEFVSKIKSYCDVSLYNCYGPTETTVQCSFKEVTSSKNITVGKASYNYLMDVRDIDGKLVPNGVIGELYIGGLGVGKGYYNLDDKTKEVFLTINDVPYYKSGDYAIELPNGEIGIKGRIDNQIKLRGLRIEIGEIESNIARYPNIKQCVVVIKEINNNEHLCAYFTAKDEIDTDDLKEFLTQYLTQYMVPTVFMQIDEMPMSPNGKTDIKKLPEPELKLALVMPVTELEEELYGIISDMINTEEFGVTDDLYALGFTSLTLIKLNSLIYEQLGVSLDISVLFNNPTIRNFTHEIENDDQRVDIDEIIKSAKNMEYFPLTENQLGIYYECAQSPDEIKYTMPMVTRFGSDVDAEKLKESIIKAIDAHPYLKTRIVLDDEGELKQKRFDSEPIDDIKIVEVDEITDAELIENDVMPFILNNNQLFRFKIYKTPSQTVLFSDYHHLITDGTSQNILFTDIANAYEGRPLSEEKVNGFVYSLIEKGLEESEKYQLAEKYFDDKLSQEIESTVLTPNLNGNVDDGKIKEVSLSIESDAVNEFCNKYSISKNALFMAMAVLDLNKYTFSDKTLFTTIFNGRSDPNYYNTQGMLIKTIPITLNNEDRKVSIRQFIEYIDQTWKDSLNSSIYPYTKIAEKYQLKPEFFYSYQEFAESEDVLINNKNYEPEELSDEDVLTTEYKIDLIVTDVGETIELIIEYNDALYSEDYILKFLDSMNNILNQFISNNIDEFRICDVELEPQEVLPEFSEVELPFIHKRFERQVIENPDNIALVATDETLTYRELDQKANRIANALIARDVEPKSNVLVMLSRNSDLIASILGILKAGCVFIPIDLEYPAERINYIYENSQADYIISNESGEKSLDVKELIEEGSADNPNVDISCDDLAYMIYTSGSTGNPKGVMISHENICNQASNPKSTYNSLLCITTISFDVSMDDILTSLSNGLKLVFANDVQIKNIPELTKLINENKPEVADFTPSRLASYLEVKEFCEAISCLKCVFLGGEQFSASVFEDLRKYSDAVVYNSYGPTETTITSNNKQVISIDDINVGVAHDNYITDVRDIDGKLLPMGVMGELYIGGTGVGKGYYNMEEKTKEVFLTINDIPYYRSGDYAIQLPNGEIDIKGRIDNQIKLRGLRIEIGEIETNIGQYPGIRQNITVIKEINGYDHLCAYYTADGEIDSDDLKEYLQGRLTRYMVPTVFMQLDEMPQTPNGKIDLKQLPEPILVLENVKPENETEERLFEMVSEFTNATEFGTTDDLYAIGLTSLALMKLNTLIYKEMDVNLDISALFSNPTIKNLANEIKTNDNQDSYIQDLIELSKEIEYYPLTENQLGVYYECIQNPDEIIYIIPTLTKFDSSVDADKLKQAVIDTVEAHPYLKTRIITTDDGEIRQKRNDDIEIDDIEIAEVDCIDVDEINKNDIKAIPLDGNQLFAFKIYRTPDETVLLSVFHHIISDGVSHENFFSDLISIYEGKEIEEEVVNGYVYSLIEKDIENSEKYELSREFFHEKLSNEIESTVLTPNLNGNPDEGTLKGIGTVIDSDKVSEFSKDNSISKNVLLTASTILALNKFTFSDKSLITTIFNGRANPNYYNTQAFLVKTIPFIFDNGNRQLTIAEFLKSVNESWKDTISHIEYPYTKIAEEFQLKPEFFYTYEESFAEDDGSGIVYEAEEIGGDDAIVTDYKINFNVSDDGNRIAFNMEYNDQLYSEDYAQKFLDAVVYILNQFIDEDNDSLRICDIALCDESDSVEFSDVELPFIHKRFERQVAETPDNVALIASDATLTYSELNQRANRIANALIKKGIEPKSNVLVMLPRESDLISAIMGILKAGCAYVPIDMEYPKERIEYIYKNSEANHIITSGSIGDSLNVHELIKEKDTSNPQVDISPDDLAYMIYTSGSTGNPKGVMISHKNITNLFAESDDNIIYNAYSKMKKALAITTISFDTFLLDFMSLTFGIEVVLADDSEVKNIEELTDLIEKQQPDALTFTTPSRIRQYLEYDRFSEELSTFSYIAVGGEILPQDVVSKILENADTDIFNIYGPTETTVTCNSINITSPNNITVGKALHNYITDVRDIDGKLLPKGVMGELYIGGVGVSRGYHNLDDKTKEVFITINDIPYYKSGDYAIELPNGEIDVKGRIDNQIKLRGLRIEIGEIEANIAKFPHIRQNVVVIKEINNNEHLCAYLTADDEIDINLLRRYLKNKLTKYMIPTVFMQIDEMPQTPNGKTDIKKLPDPSMNLDYVGAETETEEKLVELVASIANTEEFGTTDDLYTLGFSSLTLMKLNSLIYQEMGVNLDITSLFSDPTIKNLADSIDNHMETVDVNEMIELAKDMDYFPLTANQLGIYYECMQSPDEVKYTLPICIRFDSNIDPEKLKQAIITTIESHPYLKTRIINTDDGDLKQKRCDDVPIDEIEIVEVDGDVTNDKLMEENVRVFKLTEDQLFRFKIYKTPKNTILFSDFHHIITDGVSQDNIFTDITKAYNGESIEKEKVDGYAYSLIEEANSENEVSKKYFHTKLTQGIESTVLTPDLNGNPDLGEIKLVDENVNSTFVKHFCKDHAVSPNVLFMTTTILALNKFTFSDKSLITTIFNGRANPDFFNTQGMLVKTIPIIINGENREMMIEDFLKLVDKAWKESMIHSSYPYTKIAEDYQLKPEFFYAFHEFFQSEEFTVEDEDYTMDALDGTIATDYKINLNIFDDGEEVNLVLEYNDQLYSEEYAKKFLQAMKFILVQFFVNDMDKYRVCDVHLKDDFGLHEFSEVELPFIHKRFERQVAETPNNTALIATDATLTYNELNRKANRVANALIDLGIEPNSNVLIMLPRTSNLISAILGVLKAGCTFIPIDIEYPKGRIDYIFENSQADYIIADGEIENSIDVRKLLEYENVSNPHVEISPDDLAYMIYTSGSTGNPKGVMTSHKNITNLFSESEDSVIYNAYSGMHKTLALSTVSFDAFLLDFMPLTYGLEMLLANDNEIKSINELTELIKREKPDALTFTAPSRFKQYLEYDEFAKLVPNFKYIGVGGEMVPQDLVAQLLENPDLKVYNIYGPTETTVTCNTHQITDANNITVGKALHNCITEVRDIDGKLLPDGIMGELYIGGYGVARGYYNMPDKTEESFIRINDIPYYRSGDYAIEMPNGELVIKGRIDNQIKLRGLRIEIGEIESTIARYPNIKQNVVLIKEINNNEHLCAYFTAEERIDTEDLKEFLTQYLTRYMIPTVFIQLDEMPISPNGKTDIKQLPEPKLDLNYVAPENELEQLICAIFSSTLGIETVGAEDNFFEIGGTSLVASKIILELLKRDYTVKYDDVFNNQTPRQLAKFLSGEYEVEQSDYAIIDDYDYGPINRLLSENTLENFYTGEKQELGNILLTGVTGYLGIHVLYDYIKNEEGTAYCMLRKGGFDSCRDRLVDLMEYYFDEDLSDLIGDRIILSEGDITELDDFKKLEDCPIDTIINCAAIVKHYTADDYIFKVNVDGVINGIKFAQVNNINYVQVSTMSVLSYPQDIEYARDIELDEHTLYFRQDLTNKYVCSKFLAERMLLEAAVNGLGVKIVRVGNLMGRYRDGLFQKNYDTNAFLANFKSIKNIQAISTSMYNETEELSPIDCTARAIITLSKTPEKCRVFNCQNKNELYNRDIIEVLNSLGFDIREVSDEEFIEICRENMDENIQGLITSDMSIDDEVFDDEEEDYEYVLKTGQTVEILESLGFNWPKPDVNYLSRAMNYLNDLGFFN